MGADAPFDRRAKRRHRGRAAAGLARHDFLIRESAERLAERLAEQDGRFERALVLGAGALADAVRPYAAQIVQADAATGMRPDVVADEELVPFARDAFDLVASNLVLHWVNDLPGTLVQLLRSLRPGGQFLASMFGGETLPELRASFLAGEAEARGGASPHVAPFIDVRDAGGLLQRAGFLDPVADIDTIRVTYADPLALMAELRGMGEANAMHERRKTFTGRAVLAATAAAYRQRFAEADGRIRATFQIVTLTGRAPDPASLRARERRPGEVPPLRLRQGGAT